METEIPDFFNNQQMREEKLVMKIKDDCGVWIDDHKLIADKFITDLN